MSWFRMLNNDSQSIGTGKSSGSMDELINHSDGKSIHQVDGEGLKEGMYLEAELMERTRQCHEVEQEFTCR